MEMTIPASDSTAGQDGGRLWSRVAATLALATLLLLFANGRNSIPAAAWLAPVFMLRFVRSVGPGRGLTVAWAIHTLTWAFQFRGMVPAPSGLVVAIAAAYGLTLTIPYAVDRVLAPRLSGLASTLTFPGAWAATEYLQTQLTPYGSWGVAAYSQHESLVLVQLVSVTGLFGLGFLIAWFASVLNLAWEQGLHPQPTRRALTAFSLVLAVVLIFGGSRLSTVNATAETIRVASLSGLEIELLDAAMSERLTANQLTEEDLQVIRSRGEQLNRDLLERTEREAEAGARLIFWGEANGFAFTEDKDDLLEQARRIARRHHIYLGLGVAFWNSASETPLENQLILIDPTGDVVWEFFKARPVPGGEATISARGDGRLPVADTPFTRLSAAICFDMDFPQLLRQAGRNGADVVIVPANDWRAIDPWHTHMARFRAVEQGFNLVRHTSKGLSIAADHHGRVLAWMDHYTAEDRTLVSQVPTAGTRTIYSVIGDLFAWLCLAGLAVLVISARRSAARTHRASIPEPSV